MPPVETLPLRRCTQAQRVIDGNFVDFCWGSRTVQGKLLTCLRRHSFWGGGAGESGVLCSEVPKYCQLFLALLATYLLQYSGRGEVTGSLAPNSRVFGRWALANANKAFRGLCWKLFKNTGMSPEDIETFRMSVFSEATLRTRSSKLVLLFPAVSRIRAVHKLNIGPL